MSDYNANPVPLGRSGTGAAVVFGPTTDGLGTLRMLQKSDAMAAAIRARAQAAAQKQADASLRDFSSKLKLNDEAGVSFIPAAEKHAKETSEKMLAVSADKTLSRDQQAYQYQQLVNEHARFAKASVTADKFLLDTAARVAVDKRYNRDKTYGKLHESLYEKNEDGTPKLSADGTNAQVSPLQYDPRAAEEALASGNEHINTPELFSNFVDTLPDNSVTYSKEPLPGGQGVKRVAKSNVFELNEDGTYKLDPKTSKRILKNTPEMLAAFLSDPLQRQWLDAEDAKHEQQLAGVVEKMKTQQPLTEEEQRVVATEQSVDGRKMELVKNGLMNYGYGRQETDLLAKAAARVPVGRAPKAPTNVVNAPTDFIPGAVLGGRGVNGTTGIVSFGMMPAITYGKPGQEAKKYRAHAKHQEIVTQRDDGSAASVDIANQTATELEYGARHLLLRGKNGTVFFPPKDALLSAERGDFGPSEEFARRLRVTHPDVKPEWYVEATPVGKSAQAPHARRTKDSDDTPEKEPKNPTRTHYVRYRGPDKLLIDQAYGYNLRNTKAGKATTKAMDDALADAEQRTRPRTDTPRPVTSGGSFYTPKLPKATKAPAKGAATPKNPAKAATSDPYAL